ncbi:MAG: hypothetical protein JWM34_4098 [Ilumatobacteraceae bacterium]|nr:hypothetical protein [Ilumatobacteraceae bacterium]
MTLTRNLRRFCVLATVFLVGGMAVAAFFHNEFRSQNWDPMQTRVNVDRAIHFGGTFYENGLVNKGVLEPMVYRLAEAITSYDGFWYAISFLVLVVSGVLAWAASAVVRFFGGHRMLGIAIGIGVFYHFALGKADYAGVLYARNMIVGLFAAAVIIGLGKRWWLPGRARWSALVVGILLGLAVQLLFVCTIAAIAVAIISLASIESVEDEREYRASRQILVLTPIAVFVAVPAYYIVRGQFEQFWSDYWTYNVYQNLATGRSLANQLVYGRDVALRYYRAWPVSFVIVVAFVAITIGLWRAMSRQERFVHLALCLWFVGAWAELVAGQRYSTHYYSILALPTALMAAAVIGHVYRLVAGVRGDFRTAVAWPLAACLLAVAFNGGGHLTMGLEAASSYSSVHQTAVERDKNQPGTQRTVRAVLDLVSRQNDPLLVWTEFPWEYLQFHRTAATRWIWKSFMLGQIYLGRTSTDYVLPKTWQWFADDMAESNPAVFLEETALPLSDGTPFAAYVRNGFEESYEGSDYNIYLRHDQADAVLRGAAGAVTTPTATAPGSSWTVGRGVAARPADATPSQTDLLRLSTTLCTRISGTYRLTPGTGGSFMSLLFDSADGTAPHMRLNISDTEVFSGDDGALYDSTYLEQPLDSSTPTTVDPADVPAGQVIAGEGTVGAADPSAGTTSDTTSDTTDPQDVSTATSDTAEHQFAIVVGKDSAALVVDGAIHAAVRLTDQNRLSLEMKAGGITLTDLHQGAPPPDSGCS